MKYSTVVLDLDGTLLNSNKEISKRNLDAVLSCYQKGMRIIFATARPPRAVNWFLPQELLDIGAFVYYNGAQVIFKVLPSMNTRSNPIVKPLKELKQYDATKILLSGNNDSSELFKKFEVNVLITDNNQLIQIMPLLASKELAITKLCELYNVELDSVIVFGDDHE